MKTWLLEFGDSLVFFICKLLLYYISGIEHLQGDSNFVIHSPTIQYFIQSTEKISLEIFII